MAKSVEKNFTSIDFQNLMQKRITRILLVCSSYDKFTLEEDGHIESQITLEYTELSLSSPPHFTQVSSADQALETLACGEEFDLIITMFNIGTIDSFEFSHAVKKDYPGIPLILLTSFSHEVSRRLENEDTSDIDYVFGWQGNPDLILAIIKMLEDRMNAPADMLETGIRGILLVEDSIRFYSAYLPELYQIILSQTNDFVSEALNERQRTLRKRSRPKILFARTYHEAVEIFDKYKDNLLGIISDVSFCRNRSVKQVDSTAGIELCRMVREQDPQLPILLQSSDERFREEAEKVDAEFVNKRSKNLSQKMADFIKRRLAFGDFVFRDQATGDVVARASNLAQMQAAIESLPIEVLLDYSDKNMFSRWLYARGLFALGTIVYPLDNNTFENPEDWRQYIADAIKRYRRQMGQGVVAEFDPKTYNEFITFARIGTGSLGGKARGLAFISNMIEENQLYDKWEGVRLTIPRTIIIPTDHFDQFIADNGLQYIIHEELDDSEILAEFVGSRLSDKLSDALRIFLQKVKRPLAVRSSSKLEDSHYQPFAGVYSTYMVPNAENPERMLRMLSKAIKSVYASMFFRSSRTYLEATSNVITEEKMAVVIQEISGTEDAGYYFPTISGVARSLNFYPLGDEKPEEGIVNIALGLGKTVVDGGVTMRFSPKYPKNALQLSDTEITLRDTQRAFYALDLDPSVMKTSIDDAINLAQFEVNRAPHFRNLKYVTSTWDMQSQRISDSPGEEGRKIVTFAHILKYNSFPLADIISYLLELGAEEMKSPVEIEFAVNMDVPYGQEKIFNFLQIRPIVESSSRSQSIDWKKVSTDGAILYSESALGLGRIHGLRDIIYVRNERFNAARNPEMAAELDTLNESMKKEGLHYVLVGPGRWGSSDPWLGIPVKWANISQSRVIAEAGLENFRIDPSQGTHFFQNLTSFGAGYLTLNPYRGDGIFDIAGLDAMEAVYESENFRHVRFEEPLYIFVDGKNNKGIIRKSKPEDNQ